MDREPLPATERGLDRRGPWSHRYDLLPSLSPPLGAQDWFEENPVGPQLTCLRVNLRGEVCGGARREVVVTVGDEGCQRVHVMWVLNNGNFI